MLNPMDFWSQMSAGRSYTSIPLHLNIQKISHPSLHSKDVFKQPCFVCTRCLCLMVTHFFFLCYSPRRLLMSTPAVGLARMELTFIVSACIVCCFGLVTEAALVTPQCFQWLLSSASTESALFFPHSSAPSEQVEGAQAGDTQDLGGDIAERVDPNWPKG